MSKANKKLYWTGGRQGGKTAVSKELAKLLLDDGLKVSVEIVFNKKTRIDMVMAQNKIPGLNELVECNGQLYRTTESPFSLRCGHVLHLTSVDEEKE